MRTTWIPALALIAALALPGSARAGKVRSGQVTPGSSSVLSKPAQKLVGSWRMVAFQLGATRRPFPSSKVFSVTLKGDGTLSVKNVPQAKTFRKARWNVQGKHVVITHGKKVQKLGYSYTGGELAVSMPGNAKYRIILRRMAKPATP